MLQQQGPTNDNSNPQQGSNLNPKMHINENQVDNAAGSSHSTMLQTPCSDPKDSLLSTTPFPHRPGKIPPTKKDTRKLFVGGLPANITEGEFREFFTQFGKLVDSVVMFDRETRRSRGFGFVTFEEEEVAHKLLMMGNEGKDIQAGEALVGKVEIQGKICEVKAAQPKDNSSRGRQNFMQNGPSSLLNNREPHAVFPMYDDGTASAALMYPSNYHAAAMQMYYPSVHYGAAMYGNYMPPYPLEHLSELNHPPAVPSIALSPIPFVPPVPLLPLGQVMPPEPFDGSMVYGYAPPIPVLSPVLGSVMQHAPIGNFTRDDDVENTQ